jgi:membrane-associated phospholipid phosphatase
MRRISTAVAAACLTLAACTDAPTSATATSDAVISPITARIQDLRHSATPTSSVRWNRKAVALFRVRGGSGRTLAYLGLAEYRAVLAALRARTRTSRPSLTGAAAGASVVVMKQFYPLDATAIDAEFAAQRAVPGGDNDEDDVAAFDAGAAIGQAVGVAVLKQAATDGFGATDPGPAPVGPGFWVTNGTPAARGGLGARPFFLNSTSELRSPPPPAFGSAEFLSALNETKQFTINRTPEQLAIVRRWVPFSDMVFDSIGSDLIDKYHRSELEAAAIYAYAFTAVFDAGIACFDTKYHYWYTRPSQADAGVILGTGLPNHPSYPSGHACANGAASGILKLAFPRERVYLEEQSQEGALSRLLGGLHYRFDGEAGLTIGRQAAELAVQRRGIE